jgi:hypothetical protein
MKDSEVVAAARDLIKDPAMWIKAAWCVPAGKDYSYPTKHNGAKRDEVRSDSTVTRFCIEGALKTVLGLSSMLNLAEPLSFKPGSVQQYRAIKHVLIQIAREEFGDRAVMALRYFNDYAYTTHEEVMALMDKGIAKLQETEGI